MPRPFKPTVERVRRTTARSVSMPVDLMERVEEYASLHEMDYSAVVKLALRRLLENKHSTVA